MGLFNDYMREGRGVDKAPDNRPRIVVFFDIFFRKFWSLVKINLLFIVACLPVVTIGPAIAGTAKLLRNYAREEHAFILSDFWDTFKQNFWRAFVIWLADTVIAALLLFDFYMYLSLGGSAILRIMSLAVLMISATVFIFMNYYIFTMLVTFRLTLKQLVKNAFIFAWVGFFRNLLVTAIIAALTFVAVIYFFPFGFFYVAILHFALCGLIISFATYPLIKRYMIDGYDPETGERLDDKDKTDAQDAAEEL